MERKIKPVVLSEDVVFDGKKIYVQSMLNRSSNDLEGNILQAKALEEAGCEIVRVAILDFESLELIPALREALSIPVVADIHFNHELAIKAAEFGANKIRINPGNIGSLENIEAVAKACKKARIPIRVGVNSGSLEKDVLKKYGKPCAEALVFSAFKNVELLEKFNFYDIVVSIKSSNVSEFVKANEIFRERSSYPLHIGVTEAGTKQMSTVKSSIGIGSLLLNGIGETLRVSITGDPLEEVEIGHKILKALNLEKSGVEIISCPTCGRTRIDVLSIANKLEEKLKNFKKPLKVAVMGCVVNGPGEAKEADIGLAGGDGFAALFKKGEVFAKIKEEDILKVLLCEIEKLK